MKKILTFGLSLIAMITLAACSGTSATAASTIAIDVNPSVVLELDENDEVINVILNNEDAETIVGDMDLIGVDYNVALNALIGSMVANGYISELANSVLLSISSDDAVREVQLLEELAATVSSYLEGNAINGSVITQSLDFDDEAEALAEQLGISEAKAELILEISEIDPRVVVEDLALLSINELNLLLEAKNYAMDNVQKVGSASELGLITADEAYQAALTELAIDELTVVEFEVELEQEDGVMVYEVEIETADDEFELLINATDGTVFVETDDDDDDDDDMVWPEDALTEEEILAQIATDLGLDTALMTEVEVEAELDNGIAYYEVEFEYEGREYELEIDAQSGEIYSNSMDEDGYDYDDEEDDEDEDYEDEDYDDEDVEDEEETETETETESEEETDSASVE